MTSTSKDFVLPFIKKEKIAKDTYSFYFNRKGFDFDFLPGQYIRMVLEIGNPDERGALRLLTISSSPLEKDYITIATKIIESSFKKKLAELKIGEKVQFFGPSGGFVLNEEDKSSRVFLAGGIGITPFHSMIAYAFAKNLSIPITLLASFSKKEDVFWYDEFRSIAVKNPNIKVVYAVTHPPARLASQPASQAERGGQGESVADREESENPWKGEIGRISAELIKKYVRDIFSPKYYIVGPPPMVSAMEEIVKGMGVSNQRIFIENFTGY